MIDTERLKSAIGAPPVTKINADKDQKVKDNSGEKIGNQNNALGNNSSWGRSHHDSFSGAQRNNSTTQKDEKIEIGRVEVAIPLAAGLGGGVGQGGGGGVGSVDLAPPSGPGSVVQGSNLNLQSQLRNLLKCGGTSSAVNPFAPRKTSPDVPQSGKHFLFLRCFFIVHLFIVYYVLFIVFFNVVTCYVILFHITLF